MENRSQKGSKRILSQKQKRKEKKCQGSFTVKFPTKRENNLKYALQNVKSHPLRLLFSQNTLNLVQNKSKVLNAS